MFWGLIMEPQRRYTQQVKKAFHISMAALDLSTSSDEPAQVMCGFEGRNYLLCTLKKPDLLQCPLNLNFDVGSEVSFAANGKCHVHLTGYLIDEHLNMSEEEAEDEQEDDEIIIKNKKRSTKGLENGPPNKKLKSSQVSSSQYQNEDSDSDDSNFGNDVKTLLGKSLDDSDDDSEAIVDENEEDDEEDDEEEDEEEEENSSLSEGESDKDEEEKNSKLKMNGVLKKQKQEQKTAKQRKEKQLEQNKKSKFDKKEGKTPNKENQSFRKKKLQGGIIIEDIREGQGAPAKNGKFVNVYYEGRLKQNNKLFDATTKGAGFSFCLGAGEVIKGWDIGVAGMKPGGKRRIICPPSMAYGQKGSPPAIPPNSTLVFEVELKKFN